MSQQISTNTFTVAKWVVSADPTQGTHTTIQAAINSASSGDNVFIRTGTYTEDLTLKVGVNITAMVGDSNEPTVTIIGKSTFTGSGTATISGIRLQTNSDFLIVVSGSNASTLKLRNCYLNCTNNTGISFTNSNAASVISFIRCLMDMTTTGIALYSMSSTGTMNFNYCQATNTGGSTTQSSNSAGIVSMQYCNIMSPLATSSAGVIQKQYVTCDTSAQNVTSLTTAGTGTSYARYGNNLSGTASAISIGAGSRLDLFESIVNSTNTNAITGAGTIKYGIVSCINSPGAINVTTVIPDDAIHIIGTNLDISDDANASTINIGTGGAVKGVTLGSTTASSTTTIQAPSGGVSAIGVASVAVANKNYVTINTATGALGSDAGAASSISITGNTGGALTGAAFTFTGGTTGLTFAGAGSTETLGGTLAIANGGTNATSMANTDGVTIFDGTRLVTTAAGTNGQVLTGVTGSAPTFQSPAASSISITGNSGGALTGNAFTFTGGTTGLTFAGSGTTETLGGTLAIANGGTNATSMANTDGVVYYDGTRLVTTAVGTATQVLTSNGAGVAPTFQAAAASSISITGDTGGALTGNAFTFTGGTTGLSFGGAGSTETLSGTLKLANGGTNANLTASNGGIFYSTASAGAILSGTATANQMLQSGASTTPAWSTSTWPATTTINQLLYSSAANTVGGVTAGNYGVLISSSAGVPSWLANGTTGQVLTATTSGTPSWAAAASGGITTINGDTGSATGSTVTFTVHGSNNQYSPTFAASGSTVDLNFADANGNIIIGDQLAAITPAGSFNIGMGPRIFAASPSGGANVAIGYEALNAVTTGYHNVVVGQQGAVFLTTGNGNTLIGGYQPGASYTGAESNNIIISTNADPSVIGDSNTLRLGSGTGTGSGNLNKAFIAGIQGITVSGAAVLVSTGNQLGVAVSSRKYKENIVDMGDVSSDILKLRPVTFTLKDHEDQSIQYGLIAEEVAEVMPGLIVYDKQGDPQTVQYHEMPSLLLNELQKALKRIEALEARIGVCCGTR